MYTFLDNFRAWLDAQAIAHVEDATAEYDILFVNSWAVEHRLIRRVKATRPQVRVVQRVDGSAVDYGRFDSADSRQARVNMLADRTIFQSAYSRFATREKFKVIQQDGPIIYNPVNVGLFCPGDEAAGRPDGRIRVCNAAFSLNRKKGSWQIGMLAEQNPDVEFHLCGRYPSLPRLENIVYYGHLKRDDLADVLRCCHVFIHLAENDPCPNVVIEALASGLPVLYRDSGGTPELVADCGAAVTVENFRVRLELVLQQHGDLSRRARARAVEHFSPDRIFSQYLAALRDAQRRPLPGVRDVVAASLRGYPVIPFHPAPLYWRLNRR